MIKLNHLLQSKIFLLIVILVSILLVIIKNNTPNIDFNSNTFSGYIEDYTIDGNKLTMKIKAKERIIAIYYINSKKEKLYLKNNIILGSRITLYGTFKLPSNNTIPNTFNYKKYLKSKNIYLIMNTNKIKLTYKCNILYRIKNWFVKLIEKRKLKSYYYTFILGNKDYLDINIYDTYKINGITHLFAISGMHISMIIFILKKIRINNKIIAIILYLYCFLVMFTPSVLRVTIFYTMRCIKSFKSLSNIRILLITAFILILINPFVIYDVGFIYSFTITLGLFIIKPKNIFYLSIYAFLLSLPITLYNNYEFNLLSIIINILIVPYVSLILYPLLLISVIIPFVEPVLILLVDILEYINILFSKISINIVLGKPYFLEILLYYLLLSLFVKSKRKTILIIITILLLHVKYKYIFDSSYIVSYLDVNQGDSVLLISPYKKDITMIDTGGKVKYINQEWKKQKKEYNYTNNTIMYLKSIGITHIDTLILSHGDYDHMGEAINLVNNFKVEKVIFNCGPYNDLESELIKVLDKKKIKYYSCINELNIDKSKLYFLQTKEYNNENDNSNVVYFQYQKHKFLFMGDASVTTEREILNKYNLPDIDVLKVGHHGSKTSSSKEFINEINPKYSVISVGKNNRYGHPNKEVLENLKDSKIYRTDKDGSIMFKIKNNKLKIETCTP